jgi:hypothetical protein
VAYCISGLAKQKGLKFCSNLFCLGQIPFEPVRAFFCPAQMTQNGVFFIEAQNKILF